MKARVRDTEVFFDVDGAAFVVDGKRLRERPTAFLVHGGPGADHSGWKVRYSRLAERMQVVYFDHRGHGRSARGDPRKYTLDENVEDMEALRRYLGLGPIVSIGGSYGGMVAMTHAARYPDSVSHLILVATAAHSGYLSRAREIVAERGTPEQIEIYGELLKGHIDTPEKLQHYFETMGPLYALKYVPQQGPGQGPTILEPEAGNRGYGPGGFLWDFDARAELCSITASTLVIGGRHDWICAPEFSEEIHRLIPGSELRIFEESAHAIGTDEPQQFMDVVAGFLVYNTEARRRCRHPDS